MIRHGNCLVVSNLGEEPADRAHNDPCEPPPKPSPCASRHNLTVHLSCDEAASWRALGSTLSTGTLVCAVSACGDGAVLLWGVGVYPGPAAYSSLASLPWRSDAVGTLHTTRTKSHLDRGDRTLPSAYV